MMEKVEEKIGMVQRRWRNASETSDLCGPRWRAQDLGQEEPRAEAGLETVMEEERRAFEGMLRSMLAFRPEERATAQQVLHSEWTKGWVLSALEQSRSTSAFLGS
ncbi:1,3-beta-glucanosyltransferase gel4 [Aspergillus lentulus]|nr:1,3-beta-glucanosyltransferase gel4 [Aspergillus lentulus]